MDSITVFLERTFLIERLLGVLLYVIVIGFTYKSLRTAETYGQFKKTINTCLFILCVMAFFYVPAETADLYRIRINIESWEGMTFDDWTEEILTNKKAPVAYYLYFLMSKIQIDGLLPAITCFVAFSSIFHLLNEEKRVERSSSISLSLAFLFLMAQGTFLGIISGTRSGMAFTLVARAIYDDFLSVKKNIINYGICLIAVNLHIAVLPIVAIYLFFSICYSWHKNGIVMNTFFLMILVGAVYWYAPRIAELSDMAITQAEVYSTTNVYSYVWERVIVTISFAMLLAILWVYKKNYKNSSLKTIYVLASILSLLIFLVIISYTMFHRYANFLMYISIPLIANCIEKEKENNQHELYSCIKIVSIFVFMLVCVRGDLCGYKFFLL